MHRWGRWMIFSILCDDPHRTDNRRLPRMIAIFQQRTALLGLDGLSARHPPQILLTFWHSYDLGRNCCLRLLRRLDYQILIVYILCCSKNIVDHFNDFSIHAAYSAGIEKKYGHYVSLYSIYILFNCYVGFCPGIIFVLFFFQPLNLLFSSSVIARYWKQRISSDIKEKYVCIMNIKNDNINIYINIYYVRWLIFVLYNV